MQRSATLREGATTTPDRPAIVHEDGCSCEPRDDSPAVPVRLRPYDHDEITDGYPDRAGADDRSETDGATVLVLSSSEALTCREREVLALVAEGLPNRIIARSLGISEKTVKNHLAAVFVKLGVSDRTQAALHAVRCGLVGR
jgi:DNA-binding CsgD family transcriptional regulator